MNIGMNMDMDTDTGIDPYFNRHFTKNLRVLKALEFYK